MCVCACESVTDRAAGGSADGCGELPSFSDVGTSYMFGEAEQSNLLPSLLNLQARPAVQETDGM